MRSQAGPSGHVVEQVTEGTGAVEPGLAHFFYQNADSPAGVAKGLSVDL